MARSREEYELQREIDRVALQKAFLTEYPRCGTVGKTCKEINIGRRTFYNWLEDEGFKATYQELKADRLDEIVSRLIQCVLGEIKLTQQQLLAAFFLSKAFDPKTFSEKYQLQHTGKDGGAMKVTSVEIVRAEKKDSSRVTTEDMKETVPDDDTSTNEV